MALKCRLIQESLAVQDEAMMWSHAWYLGNGSCTTATEKWRYFGCMLGGYHLNS